jgi:azurin
MIRSLFAITSAFALTASVFADDVKEVTLHPDNANPLAYDAASKTFTVKAGQKVKLTMENKSTIPQPHNLLVLKVGSKDKVGALANAMLTDPNAMAKDYVPESPDILWHTKLIQPGQSGTLEFTAPAEAGDYPYMCTFPGHWMLMNGVMKVEK